jgi:hypothetical protein
MTVAGQAGVRADYANVRADAARAALPQVVRGRQVAWLAGGMLYVLALEAPEPAWVSVADRFDHLVAAVAI